MRRFRAISFIEKAYRFLVDAALMIVETELLVLGAEGVESGLGRVGG
jgi:hypothetical protein